MLWLRKFFFFYYKACFLSYENECRFITGRFPYYQAQIWILRLGQLKAHRCFNHSSVPSTYYQIIRLTHPSIINNVLIVVCYFLKKKKILDYDLIFCPKCKRIFCCFVFQWLKTEYIWLLDKTRHLRRPSLGFWKHFEHFLTFCRPNNQLINRENRWQCFH